MIVGPFCPGECIGNYCDPSTGERYPCEHQNTNRRVAMIERRAELGKAKEICSYCKPHRGENRTHTSPHADVRKSKRRKRWK